MSSEQSTSEPIKLSAADTTASANHSPVLGDSHLADDRAEPVPEDSHRGAARTAEPVPGGSASDDLGATRSALLAAYHELLRQITAVAGDPRRADEVTRLADAAGRLVDGRFARRLVFGE